MTTTIVIVLDIVFFFLILFLCSQLNKSKKKEKIFQEKEEEWKLKHNSLQQLNKDLTTIQEKVLQLQQKQRTLKNEIDEDIENKRSNIEKLYDNLKASSSQAFSNYVNELDKAYENKEKEITNQIDKLEQEKTQRQNEKEQVTLALNQLKSVFDAATAARLREQEEKDKRAFYELHIPEKQIKDITLLQQWKSQLNDPSIVSKIIWSSYIIKPTSDLCNRVLGTKPVCGIYKITNRISGDTYIGQSVNIADRWKAHIKCGLGIDAPATNRLYNNMQQDGVWNCTFEILQKAPKEKLNEKERFWINMYQSDKVGLNSTKGNKT